MHVFDAAAPIRAGHYTPATRKLEEIEAVAGAHEMQRLVLVQPSVYGTDNTVLLRALRRQPGRHRGVTVVDADVTDEELDAMHEAGVRGVRFNLVSPVGNGGEALAVLAPRLRARGWHAQWYATPADLPRLAALQREHGVVFVLDHLAGLRADEPPQDEQWTALHALAMAGSWLKLSGWYRLGSVATHADIVPTIRRAASMFGDRLVWGSDWPHTSLPATSESRHAAMLQPFRTALGHARAHDVLFRHPDHLYH